MKWATCYSLQSLIPNKHQAYLCKSFFKESGVFGPEVLGVNVFRLGVLACQHATPNGAVAYDPYAKLSAHWDQIFLQPTAPSDWLSRGCPVMLPHEVQCLHVPLKHVAGHVSVSNGFQQPVQQQHSKL